MLDLFDSQILIFAGTGLAAACQWVGIVKLAKTGRKNRWRTMLAGAVLSTISLLALTVAFLVFTQNPAQGVDSMMDWFKAISAGQVLGDILFFIGFMFHCLSMSKRQGREEELENIIAAQARELEHHRNALR